MTARTCNKIPYPTRAEALADIETIRSQRIFHSNKYAKVRKSGRKMRPYECRWCGKWHLTSQRKNKRN